MSEVTAIAFYLPQFHPIPENDDWWGKGFTEWSNVTKAKPLYNGHNQPKLPADLGFYDLRVPEVRMEQAQMARNHGISAFCYWHYWFGNGKRILSKVFDEVVDTGQPDFPFCLAWANQSWTGHWHGREKEVLVHQEYGGISDYEKHFQAMLPAFSDNRYLRMGDKLIFLVYNPWDIPEPKEFTDCWRTLASRNGLGDFYFIAMDNHHDNYNTYGMDGSTWHEPTSHLGIPESRLIRYARNLGYKEFPKRIQYKDYVANTFNKKLSDNQFPMVVPNWDNTPRSQKYGLVYENSTPHLFKEHLQKAFDLIQGNAAEQKIIFIKAWNEWAEGNYLEPDQKYGLSYLEVIKSLKS